MLTLHAKIERADLSIADLKHKLDLADAGIVRAQRNYELRKQQRSTLFAGNPTPEERLEAGQLVMRAEERIARTKNARLTTKRQLALAESRSKKYALELCVLPAHPPSECSPCQPC